LKLCLHAYLRLQLRALFLHLHAYYPDSPTPHCAARSTQQSSTYTSALRATLPATAPVQLQIPLHVRDRDISARVQIQHNAHKLKQLLLCVLSSTHVSCFKAERCDSCVQSTELCSEKIFAVYPVECVPYEPQAGMINFGSVVWPLSRMCLGYLLAPGHALARRL
jgi:hypothetical protein